jgi:hypothetical protein
MWVGYARLSDTDVNAPPRIAYSPADQRVRTKQRVA